jgi:hypothetical protein
VGRPAETTRGAPPERETRLDDGPGGLRLDELDAQILDEVAVFLHAEFVIAGEIRVRPPGTGEFTGYVGLERDAPYPSTGRSRTAGR